MQKAKVKTHIPALWSAASIAPTLFSNLFPNTVNPVAFHFALCLLHFAFCIVLPNATLPRDSKLAIMESNPKSKI
jgi:hypothetical protein